MGKPAARVIVDQAAHTGPITMGSFNVIIGGKPAARKGDPITCSAHGQASIIEGSTSVLINGIPVARMGDKTSCGTPPTPPPVGPKAAEDDVTYWSPAKDSNPKDGTVPTQYPNVLTVKPVYAYGGYKDKTGDGSYDQIVGGFGAIDFQAKGDYNPFGDKYGGVGTSGGFTVLKGDGVLGAYGSNGVYGVEAEGKATMMSGNVEGHIGKEGVFYQKHEIKADVAYIEGKAEAKVLTGGSDQKYGFQAELSGDMGAVKADYEGQSDVLGIIKTKAKAGLYGGAGAAGGKGGFYVDADDWEVGAKVGGKIALLIGIKADVEVAISAKPFMNAYDFIKDYFFPPVIEGKILTGCPTVLIG